MNSNRMINTALRENCFFEDLDSLKDPTTENENMKYFRNYETSTLSHQTRTNKFQL